MAPSNDIPPRDLFLSHASDDKEPFVRDLYRALTQRGLKVWFDEAELVIGDSLTERIDEGLQISDFGVVVLSEAFFAKRWTKRELGALHSKSMSNDEKGRILPVLFGVDREYVSQHDLVLADLLAADARDGAASVADEVLRAIERRRGKEVSSSSATPRRTSPTSTPNGAPSNPRLRLVRDWARRVDLDEWNNWTSFLLSTETRIERERFDALAAVREWIFARANPRDGDPLDLALDNFRRVLQDLQVVLMDRANRDELEECVRLERFYKHPFPNPNYDRDLGWFNYLEDLIDDLTVELTRAANLVVSATQQTVDSEFRADDGIVLATSGMYVDGTYRTHWCKYAESDGWAPYVNLDDFVETRSSRDVNFGSGRPPVGLGLPGIDVEQADT